MGSPWRKKHEIHRQVFVGAAEQEPQHHISWSVERRYSYQMTVLLQVEPIQKLFWDVDEILENRPVELEPYEMSESKHSLSLDEKETAFLESKQPEKSAVAPVPLHLFVSVPPQVWMAPTHKDLELEQNSSPAFDRL